MHHLAPKLVQNIINVAKYILEIFIPMILSMINLQYTGAIQI